MISEQYKGYLSVMQKKKNFSQKNKSYNEIKNFILDNNPNSILDFGCSHGALIEKLKLDFPNISVIDGYDPGVEKFSEFPSRVYDVLISNDVIEHIEPRYLDLTLSNIEKLFTNRAWIIIACYPAVKRLPDGRNAHLSVHPPDTWIRKINQCMSNSIIEYEEIVVKNKNGPKRSKTGTKQIIIPKGWQKELRLILKRK